MLRKEEPARPRVQKVIVDDLGALMAVLPPRVRDWLVGQSDLQGLLEVILDLGRPPQARFRDREATLAGSEVTQEELQYVVSRISHFGDDNRAGIERTLHRISAILNRNGKVVGLSCRVGRAVFGTIKIIEDLVSSGKSILILGRPGVGKTTMLREVARVLADDDHRRVIIVDTSNEIAGDGDIPHPAIGSARRMQVKTPTLQHAVMIEAVENHMPEVIVIDEMGTELEAMAARTIAERGVQLVATAHGNTLDNLVMNPTLSDLVGGIQTVTLGDEEARRRGSQKTVLERKAPPTFDIEVEIQGWDTVVVHPDVASIVDALLRGFSVYPERRRIDDNGEVHQERGEPITLGASPLSGGALPYAPFPPLRGPHWVHPVGTPTPTARRRSHEEQHATVTQPEVVAISKVPRVYPFGVNRDKLFQATRHLGISVDVAGDLSGADMVLTTKAHYRRKPDVLATAESQSKPIYVLRKNTQAQIDQFVRTLAISRGEGSRGSEVDGLGEAEEAVERVMAGEPSVELHPQNAYVRRLQHVLAERYNLSSASTGREPRRRVIVYRGQALAP